jgi:glycosyltransferase involved in cell wall biosynthesis
MDGGDRRSLRLYEGLVESGVRADLVSNGGSITVAGHRVSSIPGPGGVSKIRVAITAFLTGRDYWQAKMLQRPVWESTYALARQPFDSLWVSFLYGTPLIGALNGRKAKLLIDTQNYDPSVFGGYAAATLNPVTKLLCRRAIQTSRRALAALPNGAVLIHVSASDAERWRRDRPDLHHEVIENGCDVFPRDRRPDYAAATKQLLFVGSLSAQMNRDALAHFAKTFWPALRDACRLRVVGSNPPPKLAKLCHSLGWELRSNVSEAGLTEAYADAHYAILPFAYGAGSKLKLFEALGRGLPVLTTAAGAVGVEGLPPCVKVSDSAAAWRTNLDVGAGFTGEEWQDGLDFARRYSWGSLAVRLRDVVETARPVDLALMPGR